VLLIVVIPPEIVTTMVENPTINEESKGEAEVVEAALEEVAIIAVSLDTFLENVLIKRAVVVVIEAAVAAVEDRVVDRAPAAVLPVDVITAEKMGTFPENVLTKRTAVEIGEAAEDPVVESVQKEEEVVAGVITAVKRDTFQGNVPLSDPEEEEEAGEEVIDRVGVVEIEKGVILVEIPVISQETVHLLVKTEIRSC